MKMEPGARRLESEGDQAHETSESGTGQGSDLSGTSSGDRSNGGRGGGVDTTSRRDFRGGSRVDSSAVGRRVNGDGERRVGGSTAADAAAAAIQELAFQHRKSHGRSSVGLPGRVNNGGGGVDRHADSAGAVSNGQGGGLYIVLVYDYQITWTRHIVPVDPGAGFHLSTPSTSTTKQSSSSEFLSYLGDRVGVGAIGDLGRAWAVGLVRGNNLGGVRDVGSGRVGRVAGRNASDEGSNSDGELHLDLIIGLVEFG